MSNLIDDWLEAQRINGGSHGFECIGIARMQQVWDAAQEDLIKQVATRKAEIKSIGNALNDSRTDLTMTMSEVIIDMRQQLVLWQESSFADYLAMSVSGQRKESIPTRKGNPNPVGWKARKIQAEERYRRVMGDQWMTTRNIEKKLGMSFSTARYFLLSRFEAGQLERRKADPTESWTRSVGYEWRWRT